MREVNFYNKIVVVMFPIFQIVESVFLPVFIYVKRY